MAIDAQRLQRSVVPDSARVAERRTAAAHRAKRRRALAHNLLEDQERRDWLESKLMRPGEVAILLQVSRRTISDWARDGRIPYIVTPGGHRRFKARDIRRLADEMMVPLGPDA